MDTQTNGSFVLSAIQLSHSFALHNASEWRGRRQHPACCCCPRLPRFSFAFCTSARRCCLQRADVCVRLGEVTRKSVCCFVDLLFCFSMHAQARALSAFVWKSSNF